MVQDLDPRLLLTEVEPLLVDREADGEVYRVSDVSLQAVDDQLLAFCHPVLLSTALYNRKHHALPEFIRLQPAYITYPTMQQYTRHAPRRPQSGAVPRVDLVPGREGGDRDLARLAALSLSNTRRFCIFGLCVQLGRAQRSP